MKKHQPNKDYEFAQQVCKKLRSGHPDAVLNLYQRYQTFIAAIARRRLFDNDPGHIDEVLANFWVELLNCKAICNYRGTVSLRNYLTVILSRRIIDANRKFDRERVSGQAIGEQGSDVVCELQNPQSSETELMEKERQRLIQETLEQLEEISPRDAHFIRMHLEGLTYEEMAKTELSETTMIRKNYSRRPIPSKSNLPGTIPVP